MNELEKLIASVRRPAPSEQLDARVNSLLSQTYINRPSLRWRDVLALFGTAACIATISFYLGRQNGIATANSGTPIVAAGEMGQQLNPKRTATDVVRIPPTDQLTGLFIRPSEGEGLLGGASFRTTVITSP